MEEFTIGMFCGAALIIIIDILCILVGGEND